MNWTEFEKGVEVSEEVKDFMKTFGSNHAMLYKGWEIHPSFRNVKRLLIEQLALTVNDKKNRYMADRILGRIRVLERKEDSRWLDKMFMEQEVLG